jgi:hypothetical protein
MVKDSLLQIHCQVVGNVCRHVVQIQLLPVMMNVIQTWGDCFFRESAVNKSKEMSS